MARVSPDLQGNASRALGKRSMLRLVLFTIFAIGLFIALCSFLYTPVLQVYWGTAGRIQPKASKLRTKRLKEGLPYSTFDKTHTHFAPAPSSVILLHPPTFTLIYFPFFRGHYDGYRRCGSHKSRQESATS